MAQKDRDEKKRSRKNDEEAAPISDGEQPPPPSLGDSPDTQEETNSKGENDTHEVSRHSHSGHDDCGHHYKHHRCDSLEEALEAVYGELLGVRKISDQLLKEASERKLEKRYESVPVRISDLMEGFEAALAKANRASQAGDFESEDIANIAVKDLEINLSASLIESGHAQDPVLMLPNIKSVDNRSTNVNIRFSLHSLPLKKKES